MRLTPKQVQIILRAVSVHVGDVAHTYLFGSRLDDTACGGDIDLLIESPRPLPLLDRARLQIDLETQFELPADLIVQQPGAPASFFQHLARVCAQPLRLPQ